MYARASVLGNDLPGEPDTKQWRLGPKWYAVGLATNKPGRFQGFHGSVKVPDDPDADVDLEDYDRPVFEGFAGDAYEGDDDLTEEEYRENVKLASEVIGEAAEDAPGGILLIFDEGAAIDQMIYDAAKGALTGPESYIVEIGNPDLDIASAHEFVNVHKPGSNYLRVRVGCEPGPPDPFEPEPESDDIKNGLFHSFDHVPNWLLRPEWIEERKRDYGVGTPLYYSKIWGQFAGSDASSRVMPHELLAAAEGAECEGDLGVHIGVDVAGEGGDESVGALLVNGELRAIHAWRPRIGEPSPYMAIINVVSMLRRDWGEALAKEFGWGSVDAIIPWDHVHLEINGVGAGVCDRMRQKGMMVDKVDMGAPARYDWRDVTGGVLFLNRRAELYWVVRRLAEEQMFSMDRGYEDAWAQAQWTTFEHNEQSKGTVLKMSPKKDIRKQYGRSPDHWDAVVLAFSRPSGRLMFSTRA